MRILSLLFMPALGLVYFAGTQHFSWWSIGALGWATVLLHFVIGRLYMAALGEPERWLQYFSSELTDKALWNYLNIDPIGLVGMPIYVVTDESGIVLAHDVCTARYDGRTVILITSDSKKRAHGKNS